MKRLLLFGLVLALLAGYALMAVGSDDTIGTTDSNSTETSANTEGQQKDDETTKTMPNVIGMTAEEAQSTLKSANIQITKWIYNQSVIKDKVPSDHTINSLGDRSNGAPSDKKIWTVIGQNVAQGERVDDGVILTVDLKVINPENNSKFHTIMNEDNSGASAFVKEHKGELVEFVGTVVAWEGTYIVDIAIAGWDDKQEYVSEFFYLDNCHNMTLYMQDLNTFKPGATYHIVGRIEGYDETENKGIILKLVGMDYLDPSVLETIETVGTQIEPPEYVKRAAVTAMTNLHAFDGRVHSYSDTSGDRCLYYMFVISWGSWTQQSETNIYHVEDLQLRTYGKEDGPTGEYDWDSTAYKFTLDVKYDPENNVYIISNEHGSYKEKGDSKYTAMKFIASHELFTIPISLIKNDRA